MHLARIGAVGEEVPVARIDGKLVDLRPITNDIDGHFLSSDPVALIEANLSALPAFVSPTGDRFGAPIFRPEAIYCVGMNYAAHAREGGSEPPENIIVFLKPPHTLVGAYDEVEVPPGSETTDWEAELAIVIGTHAWRLADREAARAHIAGFTVANDLSERHWQLQISGGQWSKGKGAPGFCPLGPWLITADDVDPGDLRIQSWVNGEPRQDSRTSDMIFDVDEIVYQLSQYTALQPGDVILTGTPEGVALSQRFPYIAPGDVVEIAIEGLGHQRQAFV
jgi:2,4-didehydro-3-deoxy-L-rhamnonate hydrolase